jgi:hypothetical protein
MKDASEFPYPLDTDIEEQVPVKKVQIDEIDERKGTAKFSVKTVMEKQTVRYINAPKVKVRCKSGEHVFRPFKPKKWLFACKNCPFVVKVFPNTYKFDESTGKFINRKTGQAI